jgi:superfamily II DNA or RNA helicase
MSKIVIGPSQSIFTADQDLLKKVYNHFSFKDKSAESELFRLKKSLQFKERVLLHENGGELPEWYMDWKKSKLAELQDNLHVFVCEMKDSHLIVPTGLILSLQEYLTEHAVSVVVNDQRDFDLNCRVLKGEPPPTLRKPQQESLDRILGADGVGKGVGLIRLATGVGKTALAQEVIRKLGHKAIFLVPSLPILRQTVKRFEEAFGKKNVKAFGGGKKQLGYVTVATYQSVYKADPKDFEEIDLVVADECHHVSADTFYDVMQVKLKNAAHRYGLTAFEERADNSTLLIEAAVGPVIYKYDAPEAIEDKYLARPTYIIYSVFQTRGFWTEYKMKNGTRTATSQKSSVVYDSDNFLVAYRNWVLGNDILNSHIAGLTNQFVSEGKSILILVDEKEHGERLMKLIPNAGYAIGGGKDNEKLQKDFNSRTLKVLIGTSTLGEGADTVPVDVLINLQGGASKSQTLQANGRALRNDPDENGVPRKPDCLIIDFDFPLCRILNRHSKVRQKLHKTLGSIHQMSLGK